MDSWHEICTNSILPYKTISQINNTKKSIDPNSPNPIPSVISFDNRQELLWTGDSHGRVASFYGPTLQPYTAFQAHSSKRTITNPSLLPYSSSTINTNSTNNNNNDIHASPSSPAPIGLFQNVNNGSDSQSFNLNTNSINYYLLCNQKTPLPSPSTIRDLLIHDKGILSLSENSLRFSLRRGLSKYHLEDPQFHDMLTMAYISPHEIMIGGCQRSGIFTVNIERASILSRYTLDSVLSSNQSSSQNDTTDYTIMKRGNRLIAAGTSNGAVHLFDPLTSLSNPVHIIHPHSAGISDLDTHGSLLLSTGFSKRLSGLTLDPLVCAFDLRALRALPPIPFPSGAAFVRIHSKFASTAVIASQSGLIHFVDIANPAQSPMHMHQLNILSHLQAMDLSPSGQSLAFADATGSLHLWSSSHENLTSSGHLNNSIPTHSSSSTNMTKMHNSHTNSNVVFTDYANTLPFELPDEPPISTMANRRPIFSISQNDRPLSSIGMPYYKDPLLSSTNWPSRAYPVGLPSPNIPIEVLQTMKRVDFIGYAPFNRSKVGRRNQVDPLVTAASAFSLSSSTSSPSNELRTNSKTFTSIGQFSSHGKPFGSQSHPLFRSQRSNSKLFLSSKSLQYIESDEESPSDEDDEILPSDSSTVKPNSTTGIGIKGIDFGDNTYKGTHTNTDFMKNTIKNKKILKLYEKLEIKYSKFGVEDFDFDFYNKTPFAGLETHLSSSYVNALLQLYRFTPSFYNITLCHTAGPCSSPLCLLCELGFLFDMLTKAQGNHCRASNFLHTFASIPQASALGLIHDDEDTLTSYQNSLSTFAPPLAVSSTQLGNSSLSQNNVSSNSFNITNSYLSSAKLPIEHPHRSVGDMIQSFARFFLERLSSDYRSEYQNKNQKDNNNRKFDFQTCAAQDSRDTLQCIICSTKTSRISERFILQLDYSIALQQLSNNLKGSNSQNSYKIPENSDSNNSININPTSFLSVLQHSFNSEFQTRGWCDKCRRYQILQSRRSVISLPETLTINASIDSEEIRSIWQQPSWPQKSFVASVKNNGRLFCTSLSSNNESTQESHIDSSFSESEDQTSTCVYHLIGCVVEISEPKINTTPALSSLNLAGLANEADKFTTTKSMPEISSASSSSTPSASSSHLVAVIHIPNSDPNSKHDWYVFNDFLVKSVSEKEALNFDPLWKKPCMLVYQRAEKGSEYEIPKLDVNSWKSYLDTSLIFNDKSYLASNNVEFDKPSATYKHVGTGFTNSGSLVKHSESQEVVSLSHSETPKKGTLVAIDAEFVTLRHEETEIRSDGTKYVLRPAILALARVSVVRGEGPKKYIPFIDDYIITQDVIVDYLTEYSGIEPGDLDPKFSNKHLIHRKFAYKKLWALLNLGCIFVGHGLRSDFRMINMQVPPAQVIDTVKIYHMQSRHRYLSLRFLTWMLLEIHIQKDTHDSIEDACAALKLYEKYKEIGRNRNFKEVLNWIYQEGQKLNFKPNLSASSPFLPPASKTTND